MPAALQPACAASGGRRSLTASPARKKKVAKRSRAFPKPVHMYLILRRLVIASVRIAMLAPGAECSEATNPMQSGNLRRRGRNDEMRDEQPDPECEQQHADDAVFVH